MNSDQLFTKANKLHEESFYKEAFSLFLKGAELGDTSCMNRVACMYSSGEGVKLDYDNALKWELKAIELGDLTAMTNAAITYRIKGELVKSKEWFEKSLFNGDGAAALQLAKLYMVSDKESENVKKYLNIAISHENMTESCIEESRELLRYLND